ncbi:uncharacterized protein LOC135848567 [Planococcus citri]|uniref:uncharacterized protein LOC135848567 n=1 Tax=Planococcus citri TaxID=170843 RepID=UPI0031F87B20
MHNFEEYPFIFMNTPASLQILASTEVALTLWRDKFANSHHLYENLDSFLKPKFSCVEILVSQVPSRITAQIDEKIDTIREELKNWIDFHSVRRLFDGDFRKAFSKCIKHIVADFSSSIGFKATAINILNAREFSDVENYKIACTFCLEHHVSQFWPLVENDERIEVNYYGCDAWNLSYWNECMKLGKDLTNDAELVKRQMKVALRLGIKNTWFDGLFERIPHHERVPQTISFLWYPKGLTAIRSLPLNRVQVEELFKEDASAIFEVLLRNGNYFRYAYQMWILMKHVLLENTSRFVSVITDLLIMIFHPDHKGGLNHTRCDQINSLLLEIWSDTPNELKVHVSEVFLRPKFIYFWRTKPDDFSSQYDRDMTFFVEFLTFNKSHNDYNQRLWRDNWHGFALRTKPSCFEQLMRLCLTNNDDIEIFKNRFREFNDLFRSLMQEGFYSDLRDYLMFCSKNVEQFQQLGGKVLGSNLDVVLLHDDDKFAKFDWFVDQLFSNVKKDADDFKVQLVSSFKCLDNLIKADPDYATHSDYFDKTVNRFIDANEEKLNLVKLKLSGLCRGYPIDSKCKAYHWLELVKWCITNGTEIAASRESLNIDVIFRIGVSCHLYQVGYDHLKFLDQLLNWYFANDEGRRNFKLHKIKNYHQFPLLRDNIRSNYNLLKWFFDGENENMRTFCRTIRYWSLPV